MLVSPLELEVRTQDERGRVRVTVRDAATKAGVPRVQVRILGAMGGVFQSGRTDLRGVFVAEGVRGRVSVVARQSPNCYAFYRAPTESGLKQSPARGAGGSLAQSLEESLRNLSREGQSRQIQLRMQRLQNMGGMGGGGMR